MLIGVVDIHLLLSNDVMLIGVVDDISVFGKVDGTILLKKNILTIEKLSDKTIY
jgi:hypothetical protein